MLTIKQAAMITKKNPSTLTRAIQRGDLKAKRLGKMWFVYKRDVIKWRDTPAFHKTGKKTK